MRMIHLIAAVLGLFVLQTLLPATIRYVLAGPGVRARLALALGPRDDPPPMPVLGARAARALANMEEAMPVFLTLARFHVAGETRTPTTGALVFFVARTAYVPPYLSGVPGIRSLAWVVSWVGLSMMAWPLLRG